MMHPVTAFMTMALLAAGSTPLIAKAWVDVNARPVVVKMSPTVQVLVMARDVPAGTRLQADDLRYEYWSVYHASKHMVSRRNDGVDAKAPFLGQIVGCFLAEGEPFNPDHCVARMEALQ